jgi:hypothetical protein
MEDEDTPLTDNKGASPVPLGDSVRGLPVDIRHQVSNTIAELHFADGGLSEESVVGTNPSRVLIRGLARHHGYETNLHPGTVTYAGENPTDTSHLTDPTALARFQDAEESLTFRYPRHVNVPEPEASDFSAEEDVTFLEPGTTVTGQHNNASGSPWFKRFSVVLNIAAIVLFIASFLALMLGTRRPDQEDRTEQVVRCATILSGLNVTEGGTPLRWNVTRYFIEGNGRLILTSQCNIPSSLFATMCAMIVLRESLHVENPTWHQEHNITTIHDVCRWSRVSCGPVYGGGGGINRLLFNNAGLFGTIPREIQWIRGLEVLDTNYNRGLVGPIPSEIGLLSNMTTLMLQKTSLDGTFPALENLMLLKQLVVYDTRLTGTMPAFLCALKNLKLKTDLPCRTFPQSGEGCVD